MTLNDLLTDYEELWRQAALEDRKQMNVKGGTGEWGSCAWIAAKYFGRDDLVKAACTIRVVYNGPPNTLTPGDVHTVNSVMACMNNHAKWDWLTFANKFRSIVKEVVA